MWDEKYRLKGLALLDSLRRHVPEFRLYVLCLDDKTQADIERIACKELVPVKVDNVETPETLAHIRATRNRTESYWTLTPCITLHCMTHFDLFDIAYIDADCYLFSDLAPLYAEVADAPVAIIPHRWTPLHADRLRPNGIYNVSWVYFDRAGLGCLKHWRGQCIERCSLSVGCGDQGYLDDWPERWGAHVVQHLGADLAPWNQAQYKYRIDDSLYIFDGQREDPLLFYHFHEFEYKIRRTNYPLHPMVARHVYPEYEAQF
jgi:hypothetical protein